MVMRYVHQTSKETYTYVYKVSFTSPLQVSFDRFLLQTHVDWASPCYEVWQHVKTHEHRTARPSQGYMVYTSIVKRDAYIYTCTRSLLQVSFTHTSTPHRASEYNHEVCMSNVRRESNVKRDVYKYGYKVSFARLFGRFLLQVYPGLLLSKSSQWGMSTCQKRRIYTCTRSLLHLFSKSLLTGLLYRHM